MRRPDEGPFWITWDAAYFKAIRRWFLLRCTGSSRRNHLFPWRADGGLLRYPSPAPKCLTHRVANSLQIIASVLMQSARKVQSEEARGHLQDAHHRVMSIAAVQRHLAVSSIGDVALRPYFVQLCESLAASMISDPNALSIDVTVDDSVVAANKSVSLGLIVTELVINALKHAFPGHARGKIVVGYKSVGADWTLSVKDDGIGMPTGNQRAKTGLGTGIIEALAKHLDASIQVLRADPGVAITISQSSEVSVLRHAPAA
jgi:two-component sensor histidine kinase